MEMISDPLVRQGMKEVAVELEVANTPQSTLGRAVVLEAIVAVGLAVATAALLFRYAGAPVSWDEFDYMHTGLNPEPLGYILNRYFHIYFQKPFLSLASTPLIGAKIFWVFLVSSTGLLVYWCARSFSARSCFANGLLAVGLFFSNELIIFAFPGTTYADFTVMFMIMAALSLYLLILTRERWWLLLLLGVLSFLTFKGKETGIVLTLLWVGLAFEADGTFNLRRCCRRLGIIWTGVLIGQAGLMVLDAVYLKDALFSLRPSSWQALLKFNFREFQRDPRNWFSAIMDIMPAAFLLYWISAAKARKDLLKIRQAVIWLLPLGIVFFLSATMIRGRWGVIPRYCLPLIPVFAVLASQFFNLTNRKRWALMGALGIGAAGFAVLDLTAQNMASLWNWDYLNLAFAVVIPFSLAIVLGMAIIVERWNTKAFIVVVIGAMIICLIPIRGYVNKYLSGGFKATNEKRFTPFRVVEKDFKCGPNVKVLASTSTVDEHQIKIAVNALYMRYITNVYFGCNLSEQQVTVGSAAGTIQLLKEHPGEYTYIYISDNDWKKLNEDIKQRYRQLYSVHEEPQFVVLLKRAAD
jgi:hypothetical protein